MKKFKIPPCQNHSLSPISMALAQTLERLANISHIWQAYPFIFFFSPIPSRNNPRIYPLTLELDRR